ncbi:5-carboxymethyl-2-hydroxymuconate isomerase [Asticcacaulis sp. AC460]|uniref:fumarylacetoacetate hydrolase family protein n=1 Tax=Asticcacaulis sp. AC460 TaxID=1282360 RepID=UPI0003C3B524|nr:fumarylacetoacetate hydrolase family protein [Asticcacaulis sp. AC460]ESQ87393.1 5-carboxymethyl-2-hydroxymuconate isomerase [Asticcacaulis sp. AC460]
MKYISYHHNGRDSWGHVEGDHVSDLGAFFGGDLKTAIAEGRLGHPAAHATIALSDVKLLPVIPNPSKIFCVGHNYETHRAETGRAKVGHPSIFLRFADTLIADGDAIVRPVNSTSLDYEAELALVIGKTGRHISEADAMSYVAGFACANDASVRDWQWHTTQFAPGKNFPGTAPLGPWLVTPDEITDLEAVKVVSRLNGQVMQEATLGDLIFPLPVIISYLSGFTTLNPGDVILTGTPGGVGAKREPPVWMKPGDVIEVDITGVGLLKNTIADEVM